MVPAKLEKRGGRLRNFASRHFTGSLLTCELVSAEVELGECTQGAELIRNCASEGSILPKDGRDAQFIRTAPIRFHGLHSYASPF